MAIDSTAASAPEETTVSKMHHLVHWHPHIDLSGFTHAKLHTAKANTKDINKADAKLTTEKDHWQWHFPHVPWPAPYMTTAPPTLAATSWSYMAHTNVIAVPNYYLIEIEAAGLREADHDRINVEWMSPRTITIAVDIPKTDTTDIPKFKGSADATAALNNKAESQTDGGELTRVPEHEMCYLVKERHHGEWRRSFTLPKDAYTGPDAESGVGGSGGMTWEVEDGLIRIAIPRRRMEQA